MPLSRFRSRLSSRLPALLVFVGLLPAPLRAVEPSAVEVRVVADEAEAVLHILDRRSRGETVTEADWQRLVASEGYVRLKKRETGIRGSFDETEFRSFVLSGDLLGRAPVLAKTVAAWGRVDASAAARRALAYLPPGARIRARIYPVIKPRDNSFVFEVKTDPAIFLYVDPEVTAEKFENTLAHELHHIGFGGSCPPPTVAAGIERLPPNLRSALLWSGAFGEGLAMLAAAGGPDVHPHAVSKAEERERWDRDVARTAEDLRKIDAFFRDVLAGKLSEDDTRKAAMSFFGEAQGPWYTVGWMMASTIERAFGRDRLIESACDPRKLLATCNDAVRKLGLEKTPLWSEEVVRGLSATP